MLVELIAQHIEQGRAAVGRGPHGAAVQAERGRCVHRMGLPQGLGRPGPGCPGWEGRRCGKKRANARAGQARTVGEIGDAVNHGRPAFRIKERLRQTQAGRCGCRYTWQLNCAAVRQRLAAAPAAPMPTLLQRLKLRHKLAALSVVGVAMCILPLVQVLRYQGQEIQRARSASPEQDAGLLAVSLQRGLLGHRDAAGQVLRGHHQIESERRLRQVEVDTRLAMLDHAVAERGPDRALQETQDMRRDWVQLVQQVLGRKLTADASDAAHRLLVEQTLQVIDLVAGASPLLLDSDPQVARQAHALLVTLPRRTLSLSTPWAATAAAASAEQALRVHLEEMALAHTSLQQTLAERVTRIRLQHRLVLGALAALGLLALWLAVSVLRAVLRLERQASQNWAYATAGVSDGQSSLREAMHWLMKRARRPTATAPASPQHSETQRDA